MTDAEDDYDEQAVDAAWAEGGENVPAEVVWAELGIPDPRRRTFVPREEVRAAFAVAPVLDAEKFRRDLDTIAGQNPFDREW